MKTVLTAAVAVLISAGIARAQAPAPQETQAQPPAATAPPPAATVDPVKKAAPKKAAPTAKADRTPESLACSAELDAKNIHGKDRRAAMRKCKADAKKKSAAAPQGTGGAPAAPAAKK